MEIMNENDIDEFNTKTGKIVYSKKMLKNQYQKKCF